MISDMCGDVAEYFEKRSINKKEATNLFKLTLLSSSQFEIANFIKKHSRTLTESQVDALMTRFTEIKLDEDIKKQDRKLKRRISLLEKESSDEELIEQLESHMKRVK